MENIQLRNASYYNTELKRAELAWKRFYNKAIEITKEYRGITELSDSAYVAKIAKDYGKNFTGKYNILYSITGTIVPWMVDKNPRPDFRRRFTNDDVTAAVAASILEKASTYINDCNPLQEELYKIAFDTALVGFGCARVNYEAQVKEIEEGQINIEQESDGTTIEENALSFEMVASQKAPIKYINYTDIIIQDAKTWENVEWIAFKHYHTKDEFEAMYPGEAVPDMSCVEDAYYKQAKEKDKKYVLVYEIWDKSTKRWIFMTKGADHFLKDSEPPFNLTNFFPIPEPVWANFTNETIIPIADFCFYEDLYKELTRVNRRITNMLEACRTTGVYDSAYDQLSELFKLQENRLYPIPNFSDLAKQGGLNGVIGLVDISPYIKALQVLMPHRKDLLDQIYEVTGINEILRGGGDPTATATQVREQVKFGGNRLTIKRERMNRFLRDLFRIQAEIISEHFEPEVLSQMTNEEITPEVLGILRSDLARSYSIDIESDETMLKEAAAEKQDRMLFVDTVTNMMNKLMPLVQAGMPIEILSNMLAFSVKGFKHSDEFDDVLKNFPAIKEQMDAQKQAGQEQQQMLMMQQQQAQQEMMMQQEAMRTEREQMTREAKVMAEEKALQVREQELFQRAQNDNANTNIKQQELYMKASDGSIMPENLQQTDVQKTAFNGAQVSSMIEVAEKVLMGTLSKESGISILVEAFNIQPEIAALIIGDRITVPEIQQEPTITEDSLNV